MKEYPILFSAPMVQAIIAGRKTQTRRIIKPPAPEKGSKKFHEPYGTAGDLLYVRESWKLVAWDFEDQEATLEYADGIRITHQIEGDGELFFEWLDNQITKLERKGVLKMVSALNDKEDARYEFTGKHHSFSPSIHLPKWGSRIWLKNAGVRKERLQDITEQDAIAEGVVLYRSGTKWLDYEAQKANVTQFIYRLRTAKESFRSLWKMINGYNSWNNNPSVRVVSFEVLSTAGKPSL